MKNLTNAISVFLKTAALFSSLRVTLLFLGCPSMSTDGQSQPTDALMIKGQRLSSPSQTPAPNSLLQQARSSSVSVLRSHGKSYSTTPKKMHS